MISSKGQDTVGMNASKALLLKSLAICALVLSFNCIDASAFSKQVDGFKLVQKSALAGLLNVRMYPQGTCIEREGFVFITNEAADQVTVINLKSRRYCVVNPDAWKPPFTTATFYRSDGFLDLKLSTSAPVSALGLKAELKTLKTCRDLPAQSRNHREALVVREAKVVVTRALPCGPIAWKICSILAGLPDLGGYPLSERYSNELVHGKEYFQTISLMPAKFDLKEFSPPSDYKLEPALEQVYQNSENAAALKDLLEGFTGKPES